MLELRLLVLIWTSNVKLPKYFNVQTAQFQKKTDSSIISIVCIAFSLTV